MHLVRFVLGVIALRQEPRQSLAYSVLPSALSASRSGDGTVILVRSALPVRSICSTAFAVGSAAHSVRPSCDIASPETKAAAARPDPCQRAAADAPGNVRTP